ncbi:MAG TPA: SNF2-related protein [Ktedonobacterales bacterium]
MTTRAHAGKGAQRTTAAPPLRTRFTDPHGLLARLAGEALPTAGVMPDSTWPRWYALALQGQRMRVRAAFDRLIAPGVLYDRLRPHPYQMRVVERVLREMAPAAILADEVGLGKTIEAGLILKELVLRGIVQTALILAPKALVSQWQAELREHFDLDFALTDEKRFQGFEAEPCFICSLPQFVRSFDKLGGRTFDLLIADEAHLLANPASKRRKAVKELRARWRLLLTATPIANKLTDLYSLVDLVAPGRLGTQREFETEYVADPGTYRVLRPARKAELTAIARDVMCRTRRSETEIAFVGRTVETRIVSPTPEEDALITDVTDYLRALYRRMPTTKANRGAVIREIMALQQSLSSSPRAIERSLRTRAERHPDERALLLALAERAATTRSAKEQLLMEVLGQLGREPALIFTLRLETAARLRELMMAMGRSAECYVGALSRGEREELVGRFNGGALQTLIATDAGAEGLNLHQRCHVVVNADLHWNPMRIEQRIGRVHRLGQSREVQVYNFVLKDTIDDYVVRLLYEKVNLFTMTIGAMETVLAEVQEGELDLEERLLELLMESGSRDQLQHDMERLGQELARGREQQRAATSLTEEVLG